MDNCPTMIFLGAGAGALETHRYISELLGKMTIDTASDGRNGNQMSANFNRTGRELMTPQEVKRMNRKHCIIFMEEENPIYDRKALPWEMPDKIVPFKTAMKMNKKSRDKGYIHPVSVAIDRRTGEYHTIKEREAPSPMRVVDEIPEGALAIKYDEDEFLHANFEGERPDAKQVLVMYREFMRER